VGRKSLLRMLLAGVGLAIAVLVLNPGQPSGPDLSEDGRSRAAHSGSPDRLPEAAASAGSTTPKEPAPEPKAGPGSDEPRSRVTGTVLDDRGNPIEGATVISGAATWSLRPPGVRTKLDGRFELRTPLVPPFLVLARRDGYETRSASITRPGVDVEISLRRFLRIFGEVVDDANGERVGKVRLVLRRLRPMGEPEESGPVLEMKKGRFVLGDLAAGRYVLTVNVPGYDGWTSEEIVLSRDAPDAKLEVRVGRSGPWGALKVVVQDPTGLPVTEVNRVLLHDPDSEVVAMTDFGVAVPVRLEAPAGRHLLRVRVDGFLPESCNVEVRKGREDEVTVTLRAAGHVRIEVVDIAGEEVRDFRLAIFDVDGEELDFDLRGRSGPDDFDVELASEPLFPEQLAMQGTVGKNQVVPNGPVEMKNLPPGRYRIVATREGVNPAEATVDVEASATAKLKLTLR